MVATYDSSLSTALDRIRKEVGDTDTAAAVNQDEEIEALVARYGEGEATARVAESMIALFAQDPDHFSVVGGITVTWGSRIPGLAIVAKSARQNAARTDAAAGGTDPASLIAIDAVVHPHDPYAYYPASKRVRP
jgi:hypothetical protein